MFSRFVVKVRQFPQSKIGRSWPASHQSRIPRFKQYDVPPGYW